MPAGSIPLLISIVVLVILSAFFSATETAFNCANHIRLKALAASGNKRAQKVLDLAENKYDRLISTILIGNNIVNLSASAVSAALFAKLLLGSELNSSVISTIVITVVVLLFGEITPKYVANACAENFALAVCPVVSCAIVVLYPLTGVFSLWKILLRRIFRLAGREPISEDEIITMVEEAEEDGTIRREETNMIRSVIEFDDLDAGDILVPRVNITAVDSHSTLEDVRVSFSESGFSRLPVYEGDIDTIVGIIHEKDFYKVYEGGGRIRDAMQKPFFASAQTKISRLLKSMQASRVHMAIILDEYGGTLGLVTMEDILEELVGEIYDEHDSEVKYITDIGDGEFLVNGETPMDKLVKFFGIEEDDTSESNTLSGWIIEQLGDFPEVGTKITYKGKLALEVLETDKNKVSAVRATRLEVPRAEDAGAAP